jgi:hypothetical protein
MVEVFFLSFSSTSSHTADDRKKTATIYGLFSLNRGAKIREDLKIFAAHAIKKTKIEALIYKIED